MSSKYIEVGEGGLMTIHEYGKDNQKIIVLIHPSVVMWDYFEYVTPLVYCN